MLTAWALPRPTQRPLSLPLATNQQGIDQHFDLTVRTVDYNNHTPAESSGKRSPVDSEDLAAGAQKRLQMMR